MTSRSADQSHQHITFFRSYWEALAALDPETRAAVLDAIFTFVFEGREPELTGVPLAMWTLIRPNVVASLGKQTAAYASAAAKEKKAARPQPRRRHQDAQPDAQPEDRPEAGPFEDPRDEVPFEAAHEAVPFGEARRDAEETQADAQQNVSKTSADAMQNACRPHADAVQNACRPHADAVQNASRPHADGRQLACRTSADRMQTVSDKEIGKGYGNGSGYGAGAVYTGDASPPARFSPPGVEDVERYCRESGVRIDARRFVDYYTANGWRVGRAAMCDWQAAARAWASNGIDDRPGQKAAAKPGRNTELLDKIRGGFFDNDV